MLPPESFEFLSVPGGRFSAEPERLGGEERAEKLWNVLPVEFIPPS